MVGVARAARGGRPPFEPSLHPEPDESQQKHGDENGDMDQAGEPQKIPGGGPGEDEGSLDVEDDEEDGDEVERNLGGMAGAPGGERAGFVGDALVATFPP